MSAERDRVAGFGKLEDGLKQSSPWYTWGPYVSERQWGTVREDYSEDGDGWNYLPHEQARSRPTGGVRTGWPGSATIEQNSASAGALERARRDPQGAGVRADRRRGQPREEVKEHWWYLDALPSHAWNRWRYPYPQAAFPYRTAPPRTPAATGEPKYEMLDAGMFDRTSTGSPRSAYAKGDDASDLLMTIEVTNAGQRPPTP